MAEATGRIGARRTLVPGLLVALCMVPAGAAAGASGPGRAGDGGLRAAEEDRVRVERAGRCGAASRWRLRVEARDGRIRVEMEVRRTTSAGRPWPARWRFVLLHERRIAARAVLVASSGGGYLRLRRTVPDFAGADAILVRAVSAAGEVCAAGAVV
jgi:hypothetical protein